MKRWIYATVALCIAAAGAFYALQPNPPEYRTRRIDPEASKDLVGAMGGGKINQRVAPDSAANVTGTASQELKK